MKTLQAKFKAICRDYIVTFCNKQDLEFEHAIDNDLGGVICVSGYYFSFDDIRRDIDLNAHKGLILEWYENTIENNKIQTYLSYIKGIRV